MKVFKLEVDVAKCNWVGVALVAAMSYEAAVVEYASKSDSGEFVRSGEIVFNEDARTPLNKVTSDYVGILCDVVLFNA